LARLKLLEDLLVAAVAQAAAARTRKVLGELGLDEADLLVGQRVA
jgi:hypothetical protein